MDLMDFDRMLFEKATKMFNDRVILKHDVEKKIFPNVVKYEMGFFTHPTWLISNAHAISSINDIAATTSIRMLWFTYFHGSSYRRKEI